MSAERRPLGSRAIRVRNRCLAVLSGREVSGVSDEMGLGEAWSVVAGQDATPPEPPAATVSRWRSPRVTQTVLLALLVVFGFVVGDHWLEPIQAQSTAKPEETWMRVTDSVVAAMNGKLLRVGQSDAHLAITLTPADVAVLVFGRPDSLEARIDTVFAARGSVRGGAVDVRGDVRLVRRGVAELRSWTDSSVIRFRVPSFVSGLRFEHGYAVLVTRQR